MKFMFVSSCYNPGSVSQCFIAVAKCQRCVKHMDSVINQLYTLSVRGHTIIHHYSEDYTHAHNYYFFCGFALRM